MLLLFVGYGFTMRLGLTASRHVKIHMDGNILLTDLLIGLVYYL